MKFDLGIRCEWAVPMVGGETNVAEDFFIGIRKGLIQEARAFKAADKKSCKRFLHKKNMVAIPGLVNGHCHLAMNLFRGSAEDMMLNDWLHHRIFPLEAALVDREFVRWGTTLAALECIRFGTTTTNDHYFFVDEAAKVWDKAGLRGNFNQPFIDFPTPDSPHAHNSEALFRLNHKKYERHERISIGVGPHAPYSCSDELLKKCAALSEEFQVQLHIHLSEPETEPKESLAKFGLLPVERLHKLGFLNSRTVCAHSVHLTDKEIKLLKDAEAAIVHNPDCNMKLASGVAPVPKYMAAGVPVALGTDGAASNNDLSLFNAMDVGGKLQKLHNKNPTCVKAGDLLRFATWEGARAIGKGHEIGSLEIGKRADIAIVDFSYPHLQPVNDVVSHLVFACQGLEVDTVICQGKVLREKDKWFTIKPQPIYDYAAKFRLKLKSEISKLKQT